MAFDCSTDTIMQPSPSHFAMRTPRSLAISRTSAAEGAEDPPGGVVAEGGGVVREPREVDEREGAGDSHCASQTTR